MTLTQRLAAVATATAATLAVAAPAHAAIYPTDGAPATYRKCVTATVPNVLGLRVAAARQQLHDSGYLNVRANAQNSGGWPLTVVIQRPTAGTHYNTCSQVGLITKREY